MAADPLETAKRRYFIAPSFAIHGSSAGLYDLGPMMCSLKQNLLTYWRKQFVQPEPIYEIETTALTPEVVLETSGHKERFFDFMTKDEGGGVYRLDKVITAWCEAKLDSAAKPPTPEADKPAIVELMNTVEAMDKDEMWAQVGKFNIVSPTGKALGEPVPFNLMFQTQLGPVAEGGKGAFLRPELAQSIFVNFNNIKQFHAGLLPFGGATVGPAFRNEIAPRAGLIRVREFHLAEIEFFVNPNDKSYPRFATVRDVVVPFLSRQMQEAKEFEAKPQSLAEAVESGLIANETLAFFIGRTQQFMQGLGLTQIRFRQHGRKEMAHYAEDCWDCELFASGGWVECVGIADRACFDLKVHAEKTKTDLTVFIPYDAPREVTQTVKTINAKKFGPAFRKDAGLVKSTIEGMDDAATEAMGAALAEAGEFMVAADGREFKVTKEMVTIGKETKTVQGEAVVPHVIEPSFGLGRILQAILEQTFYKREEDAEEEVGKGEVCRTVFRFPAAIAPLKVMLCPLLTNEVGRQKFFPIIDQITEHLNDIDITYRVDKTGVPIGRRYARNDELGVPFALTIDHQSAEDATVTMRERDSCEQKRVRVADVATYLQRLCAGRMAWSDVPQKPE